MYQNTPLTLGIEEEYQIVDAQTLNLCSRSAQMLKHCKEAFPDANIKPEFMQSQIESNSNVCQNIQEVRQEVIRLRKIAGILAEKQDARIIAASTHPFASWQEQDISDNPRYRVILDELRGVIAQFLIFGFHVHIGFGSDQKELMMDIMNQYRYFLPHILAFSTSSPFWMGNDTGLKSYRSVIFEPLPRTGIPEAFNSYSEYWEYVEMLGKVGAIRDATTGQPDPSKIWWDIRPSPKFNTLEVRIADIPTRLDEAVCIAALMQALAAKLIQLRNQNMSWRSYRQAYFMENKWRAMRYGIDGRLINYGNASEVPMRDLAVEIIEMLDDVVDELGTRQEINYLLTILENGTSADRQLQVYRKSLEQGAPPNVALKNVVEHLANETMEGIQ